MKKSLLIILIAAVCLFLFSCAITNQEGEQTAAPVITDAPTEIPTEVPTEEPTAEPTQEPTANPTSEEPTASPEAFPKTITSLPEDNQVFDKTFAQTLLSINTTRDLSDFELLMSENETCEKTDHTSAFVAAKKTIDDKELLLVLIFGTNGNEWYSNIDFAPSRDNDTEYAESFNMAAEDVLEKITPVLGDNQIIIVTGYSRGAAVANLLGYKLNNLGYKDRLYTYTFATPNTVRKDFGGCENIFNVVNVNDIVPMVPPTFMGYMRLGTDIYVGTETATTLGIKAGFLKLQQDCPTITDYYEKKFSLKDSSTGEGTTAYELMTDIVDVFTNSSIQSLISMKDILPEISDDSKLASFKNVFSALGLLNIVNNHMYDTYARLLANA